MLSLAKALKTGRLREFFNRAWQLGALIIAVGFGVWQLISVETGAIRRDVVALQVKANGVTTVLARIESRLEWIDTRLDAIKERLDATERRVEDIAARVGVGNVGGPPGRPTR
jgi:hypothetical protein